MDEFEMTVAQKINELKLIDSQKTRKQNLNCAQITDEYELIDT